MKKFFIIFALISCSLQAMEPRKGVLKTREEEYAISFGHFEKREYVETNRIYSFFNLKLKYGNKIEACASLCICSAVWNKTHCRPDEKDFFDILGHASFPFLLRKTEFSEEDKCDTEILIKKLLAYTKEKGGNAFHLHHTLPARGSERPTPTQLMFPNGPYYDDLFDEKAAAFHKQLGAEIAHIYPKNEYLIDYRVPCD